MQPNPEALNALEKIDYYANVIREDLILRGICIDIKNEQYNNVTVGVALSEIHNSVMLLRCMRIIPAGPGVTIMRTPP